MSLNTEEALELLNLQQERPLFKSEGIRDKP